ncbi:MAG TPA: glycosyltransferase family 4 protein [Casimicrobiaceae bacterium]|nr:glycosyltransferase family 4 protein [Casimicrobiaceae bacterium]
MRIAFYAPLKPADHPVPSGDRLLARLFADALRRGGHDVIVASRLRTYEGRGDAVRQRRLAAIGAGLAQRLIRRWQRAPDEAPHLWFTYHLYHKAPDPLGPIVSQVLGIPYVIAEASHAPRQRDGPWADGASAAEAAIRAADAIVCINPADVAMIDAIRDPSAPLEVLAPFIDVERFVAAGRSDAARAAAAALAPPRPSPRLVTVAMMRPGDKLASYLALADALARLRDRPWHLVVVGDGPARGEVRHALAGLGTDRVHCVGMQPPDVVAALHGTADLFVWPAVAEVLGLAMLEAQACGLPVVAGRRPGSAAIVADGETGRLVPAADTQAFADAVAALLDDPPGRRALGARAAARAAQHHDLAAAARALEALFARVLAGRHRPLR